MFYVWNFSFYELFFTNLPDDGFLACFLSPPLRMLLLDFVPKMVASNGGVNSQFVNSLYLTSHQGMVGP